MTVRGDERGALFDLCRARASLRSRPQMYTTRPLAFGLPGGALWM